MEDKEKSLLDYLDEEKNDETESSNETENNTEVSEDTSFKVNFDELTEEQKQDFMQRTEETAKKKEAFRNLGDNEVISPELGLTKADLKKDMTTPAKFMSDLKKISDDMDKEAENAKKEYERKKQEYENKQEIEQIREEKKSDFDDEYIDEEKKREKEPERIYVDSIGAANTEDEKIEEEKKEETSEKEDKPTKVVLTNVKIKKIKSENEEFTIFNELLKKRNKKHKTTRVALINSGYIADIGPLSSPEIRDLSGALASKDQFGYWEFLYKIIHEKVTSTSIGQMDFETFLKSTALIELEILMYGLFSSTYPEKNSFPTKCANPKCNSRFSFEYHNSNYMVFDDMDKEGNSPTLTRFRQLVSSQAIDAKGFFKQSKTNTLYRKVLEDSGYIVEIRFPTLYNHLYDVIAQMVSEGLQDASDVTLNRMPYIEKVLVPTDENDPSKGYYEFTKLDQKVTLLTDLSEDDDMELAEAISEFVLEQNHIIFKMHDVHCPACKMKLEDEKVNFRDLLFMTHQIRSVRKK